MRDIATVDEFEIARNGWLTEMAARAVPPKFLERLEAAQQLSLLETALLVMHVGVSHLTGLNDHEIAVREFLPEHDVQWLISRWRSGGIEDVLARYAKAAWLTFYLLGRDSGDIRDPLIHLVHTSALGRLLRSQTSHALDPAARLPRLGAVVQRAEELGIVLRATAPAEALLLDTADSHLAVVSVIVDISDAAASVCDAGVTALELAALTPIGDQEERLKNSCQAAERQMAMVPHSAVGGWPGSCTDRRGVPAWLDQAVRVWNARSGVCTSGHIPNYWLVAESAADLGALQRFSFEPRGGFTDEDMTFGLVIELPDADGGTYGRLTFWHSADDPHSLRQLGVLYAIQEALIDVYVLTADDILEHVRSFSLPIPPPMQEMLHTFISRHLERLQNFDIGQILGQLGGAEGHISRVIVAENTRYENVQRALWNAPQSSDLSAAYRRYLSALIALGNDSYRGTDISTAFANEAREECLALLANQTRIDPSVPVEVLDGRAGVYVDLEGDGFLQVHTVAGDSSSPPEVRRFDCSDTPRLPNPLTDSSLTSWLSESLQPLQALLSEECSRLVIFPGVDLADLPFHDALLDLGFTEVSYAPNMRALKRAIGNQVGSSVHVAGFAGAQDRYLAGVHAELELIGQLYGVRPATKALESAAYGVVHLAGHGLAGSHFGAVGIDLGRDAGGFLSGAHVLRDIDLRGTRLVVLSACSTGEFHYRPGQLQEQGPLDICFQLAGARAVISTARPVNDAIAFVFAACVHEAIAQGATIWDAYASARDSVRNGAIAQNLAARFASVWSDWLAAFDRARQVATDDWRLFRLVGIHWA